MNQYFVVAIIDVAIGVLIFRKKNNPAARALSYALFFGALWLFELFLLSSVQNLENLIVPFHLTRWGMFFIPPSLALFAWRLVGSRSTKIFSYVVVPGFIVSGALCILNFFFFPSELTLRESGFLPEVDNIYYLFAINALWCFGGSIWGSITGYQQATIRQKQKVKWLLITIMMCFVWTLINIFMMPSYSYLAQYTGIIGNLIGVSLLFYSTIQHDLMDIRSAFSFGLSRVIIYLLILWLVVTLQPLLGVESSVSGGVFVFSLAIVFMLEMYSRLLPWISSTAKKALVSDAYDVESTCTQLQKDFNDCVSLEQCISVLDRYVLNLMSAESYTLLLVANDLTPKTFDFSTKTKQRNIKLCKSNDSLIQYFSNFNHVVMTDEAPIEIQNRVKADDAYACISISFDGEPIATMMLGASKTLEHYRYDDIKLLEFLRTEFGQVLQRVYLLDGMNNQLGEAKKTLSMLSMMNHYHHDIKAPLAIIDGILSNNIYDQEKQKQIVLEQVERGSRLIATMASLLKGERKRTIQPISLVEVVRESLYLFNQGIDSIDYKLNDIPHIQADAEDIKILIINVLKNAIEARSHDRTLNLEISTWQNNNAVCLSIRDTGMGMSNDQLCNIWTAMKSQGKKHGSGIGLQAIKRIADEHCATIDVCSKEGVGSAFTFSFPISIAVEDVYVPEEAASAC